MAVFVQDPATYVTSLKLEVPCAMAPQEAAVVDAEHLATVNWEVFFFSTLERKERFESDPTRFCGLLTDPVSKVRFHPTATSPRVDHGGRVYFFASDSTATVFAAFVDSLANPSYPMAMRRTD